VRRVRHSKKTTVNSSGDRNVIACSDVRIKEFHQHITSSRHASDRSYLEVLDIAGQPYHVKDVPELSLFGVRKSRTDIDTHGNDFFPYIRRDVDADIEAMINKIVDETDKKMLLLIGNSTVGKSRTAAEAIRRHPRLRDYRFLVPYAERLTDFPDRMLVDPAVIWLDDVERYILQGLERGKVRTLLAHPKTVVVATIRTEELRQRAPTLGLRSPGWDLLNDLSLLVQIELSEHWSEQETERLRAIEGDPTRIKALTEAGGLGEHLSAGHELSQRLKAADPLHRALVYLVIDWARIGLAQPLTEEMARGLWTSYLRDQQAKVLAEMTDDDLEAAFAKTQTWTCQPILGASALISRTRNGLRPNDYLVQVRACDTTTSIPHSVWRSSLEIARRQPASRFSAAHTLGGLALLHGEYDVAREAWTAAAEFGDIEAMNALGFLAHVQKDVISASQWYKQAAKAGHPGAMYTLGKKLYDLEDFDGAEDWWQLAAQAGDGDAMNGLASLFEGKADLNSSRQWLEKAAEGGNRQAMTNLYRLLAESDKDLSASWLERAAAEGEPSAMYFLGCQLYNTNRVVARTWFEKAAADGHIDSMFALGCLFYEDGDVGAARMWWEKAAGNGSNDARNRLGFLVLDSSPDEAFKYWEQAANSGNEDALNNIRAHFLHKFEQGAEAGDVRAMTRLGFLLRETNPDAAQKWFERAASTGDLLAMKVLGKLMLGSESGAARHWRERAAATGDAEAMNDFGVVLIRDGDFNEALRWFERAAAAGYSGAMYNLGELLCPGDPDAARRWFEKGAAAGSSAAIRKLETLLYSDVGRFDRARASMGSAGTSSVVQT